MNLLRVLIIIIIFSLTCAAQNNKNIAVPFTLADRDRIMRTEQKLDAFQKSVDERFVSLEKSIDERFVSLEKSIDERFISFQKSVDERFVSLRNELNTKFESIDAKFEAQQKQLDNIYILLFFILGSVLSLIGFVIYDRRTAIKPIQREQENILNVLREYSKKHGDLSELLKNAGIL